MSLAMKARQKVKKKIVKDKIFGCLLLEHLQLSGQEVPQVLKSCTDFVEEHGIVDGIYRLCGIASNVQKLRQEFDMERPPDLNKSTYLQDVHCVSSLCKAYFRELPNPLLTYQLYDKFADAVAIQLEEQRLIKIREVLKDLPIPHYRTLEYLMKHLVHMASFSSQTNMHARNLAIVWAPNLLRSKDIESSGFNGTAAFMEVRVQSIVVEFILTHVEQLFGDGTNPGKENEGSTSATMIWPSCVPEEYYRSLSYNLPSMLHHGDGPPQMRPYHTVIELADPKRKGSLKAKKWKSIFNLGRSNNDSKRKSHKQDDKEGKSDKMNLRPAKSMDSLSSVPTDAVDLEQSGLKRRSPKHQLPIRRESFGAESKQEKLGYIFLDSGEQSLPMETNYTEYEEEAQAKSEPTTPKPGRSSIVTIPQGRSPKSNQNRAEKCVGVHISGPFSVTLPFHITSNLSRLTRGMECPSLNYTVLHSSEKLFSQEHVSTECDDKEKPTLVSDKGKEGSEPSMREDSDPKMENNRISLEVQDSFSFLDNQDTSLEVNTADASQSEEETFTDKIPEYSVDSEILEYELQSKVQMVEFSVEPPPDDLCTEDESEQMYYMPTGCLDTEEQWRETHDSLEDIYLSAYDDLNPLADELYANKLDDDNTVHGESEEIESMALSTENQGTEKYCTLYDLDQLEVPHADEQWHYVPSCIQTDIDTMASNTQCDGSHNNMPDTEVHCGLHLEDDATIENVADTPESGSCVVEPQIAYGHNNDLEDEATAENLGFSELHDRDLYSKSNLEVEANVDISSPKEVQGHIKEDIVEDDDTLDSSGPKELEDGGLYIKEDIVEDDGTVDSSGPKELQDGGLYRKDGILEDEDTVDRSGPKELQDGGLYRKDGILEDEDTVDSSGPKELKDGGLYSKNNSMGLQPTVENLVSCELQDHRHYSKDDILVDTTRAVEPRTSDDGMAYVQNLDIIVGKALLESADFKEEPHYSMSNINMHQNVDEAINLSDSSLLGKDCMSDSGAGSVPSSSHVETTEEQHWENEASHCEEPESISGNQLCYKDNSQPHPCSYAEGDELMKSNGLPDRINVNPLLKDHFIPQVGSIDSKPEEVNPVYSSEEQRPTHLTKSPVELEITVTTGTYHDGAVAMKMASTINKIQQAKSVPVVPPKPQFAKLPPALKTIIHVSSTLTPNRDTKPHKSEKSSRAETAESCTDSAAKRRSSWRNATSVSFDTAMALAKERQQSQHPVRRMQTYCIGDSYDVMDSSKMDNPPHVQKITVKSASNRTNRPYTCMSPTSAEAELRALPREERNTLTIHGSQPVISSEPDVYTKELPNRNRLSMPRLGTQAGGDDSISTSHQQRRSLL